MSPLCHAALLCHSDEGFLSCFRLLVMVRAYGLCSTSPHSSLIWGGHLVPLPSSPSLGNTHPTLCWGVQTTSCPHSHNEHNTETENWEELTYFLFIFCNLVRLNPNIKHIFKQQSCWEYITGHSAKGTSNSNINAFYQTNKTLWQMPQSLKIILKTMQNYFMFQVWGIV